ncbi:MAG: NUDIX hydrolase [Hyphomicrobiales bacterium]|nr:NUDIX hydrolase [Hyphomicrobiales bacterium]
MSEPSKWRTRSSRVLVEDRWITVRADDCVRADGVEISPYYILEFPDWAHVVALTDDDHVVMTRQYRQGAQIVSREIVAGCVDPDDASPQAAGARELLEETGYRARSFRHVGTLFADPARQTNRIFVILAEGAWRERAPQPDITEEIAVDRVPLQQARQLAETGGIGHAAQIASFFVALAARGR